MNDKHGKTETTHIPKPLTLAEVNQALDELRIRKGKLTEAALDIDRQKAELYREEYRMLALRKILSDQESEIK